MKFKLKDRCKTYSFWFSIASAIFLIVQAIGEPLGLKISEESYMSIINSVLGFFVVLGIITDPTEKNLKQDDNEENQDIQTDEKTEDETLNEKTTNEK